MIGDFYHHIRKMLFKWFCRRSQKTGMNWDKFQCHLSRYPIPRGRIMVNIYDVKPAFISYVRWTTLRGAVCVNCASTVLGGVCDQWSMEQIVWHFQRKRKATGKTNLLLKSQRRTSTRPSRTCFWGGASKSNLGLPFWTLGQLSYSGNGVFSSFCSAEILFYCPLPGMGIRIFLRVLAIATMDILYCLDILNTGSVHSSGTTSSGV